MSEQPDRYDDLAIARLMRRLDAEDTERHERMRAPDALHNAARWYIGRGHPVFPLKPGTKIPATAHGLKDATREVDRIDAWWRVEPAFNIGLPTGLAFDVLDIDPPNGWASLATMRADGLVPEAIAYALTPRGGMHLYVAPTGSGNRAGFMPGLDWRGIGGYVVGPPSRSEVGFWEWVPDEHIRAAR